MYFKAICLKSYFNYVHYIGAKELVFLVMAQWKQKGHISHQDELHSAPLRKNKMQYDMFVQ